jgi:hypothetical protein
MDAQQIKGDPQTIVRALAEPYFQQGSGPVVMGSCCKRLFAGLEVPVKCRMCGNTPKVVKFTSLDEVDYEKIPSNTILA